MKSALVRIASPGRQALRIILDMPLEVGRDSAGLIVADDRVSRRHARLEPTNDGEVLITDLESANGVIIDGVRISEPAVIGVGTSALIGNTRIQVVARPVGSDRAWSTTLQTASGGPTTMQLVADSISERDQPALASTSNEPDTLTIVFSDIEASIEHANQVGDSRWMEILTNHNAIIARHVEARNGRIVKNRGDGFMMCFRSARNALLTAIGIQQDLLALMETDPDLAVKVRIGLHTGEVLQDDEGDLFGRHVHVAARIGDLASGGQILVSGLLKQIAEPRGDVFFGEPIAAELKGIETPQIVHEVAWQSFDLTD